MAITKVLFKANKWRSYTLSGGAMAGALPPPGQRRRGVEAASHSCLETRKDIRAS